jgi:flagellar protein FlaG
MNTLRIDTTVAPPPLEHAAARPAPSPRARGRIEDGSGRPDGPESARKTAKPEDEAAALDPVALREAAENVAAELTSISAHSLEITFEEEDSRYVVQVLDSESGEVLRQIPPESLLEANRQLSNLRGLLFDDRS